MTPRIFFFFAGLAAINLIACTQAVRERRLPLNVCSLPNIREVRVSPEAAADWMEPTLWAFEEWKKHVPGLLFRVIVSDEAKDHSIAPCVTSIVLHDLAPPEYEDGVHADLRDGVIRVARKSRLAPEGKKACMLHELGHLLFGFGHTRDMTSIMFPVIQAEPALSEQDILDAQTAFLLDRDGAVS